MTDNQQPVLGYADLSHATIARDIGVTRARPWVTDRGEPVYVLAGAGECTCGDYHREAVLLVSTAGAVGIIAQLSTRLIESGMATEELADRIAAEQAYIQPESIESGVVVPSCPECRRALPVCECAGREWGVR
jgi:hypothetical protein